MTAKLRRYQMKHGKGTMSRPPRAASTIKRAAAKAERERVGGERHGMEGALMQALDYEAVNRRRLEEYKKQGTMDMHEIRRRLGIAYDYQDPFALLVIDGREALIKIQLYDHHWAETVTLPELRKIAIYG